MLFRSGTVPAAGADAGQEELELENRDSENEGEDEEEGEIEIDVQNWREWLDRRDQEEVAAAAEENVPLAQAQPQPVDAQVNEDAAGGGLGFVLGGGGNVNAHFSETKVAGVLPLLTLIGS